MKTISLLLATIFLVSCKSENRSYDFKQHTKAETTIDTNGDQVVNRYSARLNPVTDVEFKDEELQKMQDLIDESRRARSQRLLNKYSKPEERIDIGAVQLTQEGSDQFKLNVETIDEVTREKRNLVFISNHENESELIGFDLESGNNEHEVKTRGYCLDSDNSVCKNLVVEISYNLNGKRIIRQFNFGQPPENETEDEVEANAKEEFKEVRETDIIDVEAAEVSDVEASFTREGARGLERLDRTMRPRKRPDNLIDGKIEVQTELDTNNYKSPTEGASNAKVSTSGRSDHIKRSAPSKLQPPNASVDKVFMSDDPADVRNESLLGLNKTIRSKKRPDHLSESKHVSIQVSDNIDSNGFQSPNSDESRLNLPESYDDQALGGATPSTLNSPNNVIQMPAVDLETPKEESKGLKKTIRPLKRPDNLVKGERSKYAPTESTRPKVRPEPKKIFALVDGPEMIDSEETSLAPGVFVLPDSDEKIPLHFRDLGVETESYKNLNTQKTISENGKYERLLNSLKAKEYNQSKGGYGGGTGRGWLKNSSAVDNSDNDSVVPRRSSRKYGSGLTTDFLRWLGKEYLSRYRNDSICVNDLSAKNGGDLSHHKSHENGLDIDMNIPTSAENCVKEGLRDYRGYHKKDRDFYDKNYDLLKLMVGSGKVHVIFIDRSFIKNMCAHTKKMNLSSEEKNERKRIFNKLYHIGGHANHYHVRMVCNQQNMGCKSQGRLAPNTSTTCD